MTNEKNPQVFYSQAQGRTVLTCHDTAHDFGDGVLRSYFRRLTKEEMTKVVGAEILVTDMQTFTGLQEESYKTAPRRIDEEDFIFALEALPPMMYGLHLGLETFRFAERTSGRITTIYARESNGTCWKFDDIATLSHELVRDKITAAAANTATPA